MILLQTREKNKSWTILKLLRCILEALRSTMGVFMEIINEVV